ncbi:MAG TPA: DUF2339 domain-containing protein [Casimicrobiaceae bacterium]|nr:DUF2339 domain-containing protein [Casimicrobiaceae bacterium]
MSFWVLSGLIVGVILGGMQGGIAVAILLGVLGGGLGALVARAIAKAPSRGVSAPPAAQDYGAGARVVDAAAAPSLNPELLRRLDVLDARLARLEAALIGQADAPLEPLVDSVGSRASRAATEPNSVAAAPTPSSIASVASSATATPPAVEPADTAPPSPIATTTDAATTTATPPTVSSSATSTTPPPRPDYSASRASAHASASGGDLGSHVPLATRLSALWGLLTGGNAVTRVGIVILFFGVAFLLTYFAEIATIPIELKLAAAAIGGVLLAGLGVLLARRRPAYGLSLQGAGMGIVYLVVFAAFRLYDVLAPAPAIALLVLIAATTIVLALRHDSQPLASLALAGGFLAPVLIRTEATNPALLFGYFAILNAVIFALAWRRAWRPLNVLGFVFTFVLGAVWGYRFYRPTHYAVVQPFLALFFLFYVGIAILYARRSPLVTRAPVDGILVFGVPIVGFALQMAIARGYRYGVAWSAGTLSALYPLLWFVLRARAESGLQLLARACAALAIVFATLAIPFAVDPRATSAWWALEAAAVYWLGAVQRQRGARWFALVLQLAAAMAFVTDLPTPGGRAFLNAGFLGAALIGAAGLASAWVAERHREAIGEQERKLMVLFFGWGVVWWLFSGIFEARRQFELPGAIDGALAWVVASTAAALLIARVLDWPRIVWLGASLLPALLAAAILDIDLARTTLTHYGWLVWSCAWVAQWTLLNFADSKREIFDSATLRIGSDLRGLVHTVSAIALVAWLSWEESEWVGRFTLEGTVWIACAAALPSLVYLIVVMSQRNSTRWPFDMHRDAYATHAGTTLAALLAVWFAIVNVISPGDPTPLPYLPLLNPLDLALIVTLIVLARWGQALGRIDARTLYSWLAVGAFVALNGTVARTAHHWGDVPWRMASLLASKPLQAALTLTWTVTALAVMLWATRKSIRVAWMVGAALLAAVVVKLFALDLANLSGLTRVVAFMGAGALLLVIGYVAPLPPASPAPRDASSG